MNYCQQREGKHEAGLLSNDLPEQGPQDENGDGPSVRLRKRPKEKSAKLKRRLRKNTTRVSGIRFLGKFDSPINFPLHRVAL
jgi:hypothetical protein